MEWTEFHKGKLPLLQIHNNDAKNNLTYDESSKLFSVQINTDQILL